MAKKESNHVSSHVRDSLDNLIAWYWDEALEDFQHSFSEFPDAYHLEHPFVSLVQVVGWIEGREVYPMDFVIEQAAERQPALYWEDQP